MWCKFINYHKINFRYHVFTVSGHEVAPVNYTTVAF